MSMITLVCGLAALCLIAGRRIVLKRRADYHQRIYLTTVTRITRQEGSRE
jgi:uncharacterized membrane protein YozB (DUF420 family)